ncbi:hypothetical protein MJO28_000347, partial [Puccinia striiformis f. sp. tritici]
SKILLNNATFCLKRSSIWSMWTCGPGESTLMVRSASKIITLFKINRYSENLEAFVQRLPEAKDYHEILALEEYQFKFPVPPIWMML